nr:transposase domain-containing protein [Sphingobium sp. CFD-2]
MAARCARLARAEKLNGVEPQAYIADIIEKIASGRPTCELMPWNWTAQAAPLCMAA